MQRSDFENTEWILKKAEESLAVPLQSITTERAPLSPGTEHDYYSNADYWWPDPSKPDGLPYIHRDGESNPNNFGAHRKALRTMRTAVAHLAAGYRISGDERYARRAVQQLSCFFLEPETYMAPHLSYAQAIPGLCTGRGIGVIDTLHLTEVPFAIEVLKSSRYMTEDIEEGLRRWFAEYLHWMDTHPNGIEERDYTNNHAVCWHVQALSFARFTGNREMIRACIERYKNRLLPEQMRQDGGFSKELARTKPYGYSIFQLDNMVSLVQLASDEEEDLWSFTLPDGRGIHTALAFLKPYLLDKSRWFLPDDIQHFDGWPARASFMMYAGLHDQDADWLELYRSLPEESEDPEVRRNLAIREPGLLLKN